MAILNVGIKGANLVAVDGVYTFTVQFVNQTNNALLNDARFPQNQIFNSVTPPTELEVEVGDGVYTITNTGLNILYKDKVIRKDISGVVINCTPDCLGFPIVSVVKSNTNHVVTLTNNVSETYNWKVINTTGTSILDGTASVNNANNFSIPISVANGTYLLELRGNNCKGYSSKDFSVVNTLPNCEAGPTLLSVVSAERTKIQFKFNGLGIFGIKWRLKQGANIVRNGVLVHSTVAQTGDATFNSDSPIINFAELLYGDYTLEIEGSVCQSSVSSIPVSIVAPAQVVNFTAGFPTVTGTTNNYAININVDVSGTYNTVILNKTTGIYYKNGNVTYVAGTTNTTASLPVGDYYIKVGTLERETSIKNPTGNPCTEGPILNSIVNNYNDNLQFQFHGVNISAITWRIKQNNNIIRSGTVNPTSNSPVINYNTIPDGDYILEIEGGNCTSQVRSLPFNITTQVNTNSDNGVIKKTVGNKEYKWINARDFKIDVLDNGNVRLLYNKMSTSSTGKTVRGWLMNGYWAQVDESEETALLSSGGLNLPNNDYDFRVYWAATDVASTFDEVRTKYGALFTQSNMNTNSKTPMYTMLSIRTKQVAI